MNILVSGHSLLQFVCRCADHFLVSEQRQIRIEAVYTCCKLLKLAIDSTSGRHSETVANTVSDVLAKLLVVAITDTGKNGFLFRTMFRFMHVCGYLPDNHSFLQIRKYAYQFSNLWTIVSTII